MSSTGVSPAAQKEITEVEKLFLTDLYQRRIKLREMIQNDVRYIGVGLVALIGYLLKLHPPYAKRTTQELLASQDWFMNVLMLVSFLIVAFCINIGRLGKKFESVSAMITEKQLQYGIVDREPEKSGAIHRWAITCGLFAFAGVLLVVLLQMIQTNRLEKQLPSEPAKAHADSGHK